MKKPLFSWFYAFAFLAASSAPLGALPVDLSTPPNTLGAASDQGFATHWIEMHELDFGEGLALPVRLGFLSGRKDASVNFGTMPWRAPLLNSRISERSATSWSVLLPCGRVMALVPGAGPAGAWATPDGEWTAKTQDKHTVISRADGWEMEFDARDLLIRLQTDSGRTVRWNRDPGGSVLTIVAEPLEKGRPAILGFTVRRDAQTKLISSFAYRTAYGEKAFALKYDAERRLSSVSFPDKTAHEISYTTTPEGHPSMKVIGRDLIPTTLTWHKENRTLLSDGVWSYTVTPQAKNHPILARTGPSGEVESLHDDRILAREIFTSAEGTQTIKQKVKNGPAKGKLEKITRLSTTANQPETQNPEQRTKNQEQRTKNPEQTLYTATFNAQGLLESETDALGRKTLHSYTLHGASIHQGIRTHTTTLASPGVSAKTTETFDRRGNLISVTSPLGQTLRHEYDANNRRIKTLAEDGAVLEALVYTAQGRVASRTNALGARTLYTYDSKGNLTAVTDALGNTTLDAFNDQGLRTQSTDALGRVTRYEYDKGGRLIQQTVAHGTPIAATTLYTYDEQGRRLSVTDPAGHTTRTTYDKLGRITSRTDPLGQVTRYEYDVKRGSTGCVSCSASGLPTRIISPSGRIIERRYDTDRHLIEETTGLQEIKNSNPVHPVTPVNPVEKTVATTQHTYDLAGNLLSTTDPLGRTTTHAYNALNKRTQTTHPDGSTKTFAYNALGQLTAETNELGHTTKREYDPFGNLIALTTPEGHTTRTLFEPSPENQENKTPVNPANPVNPVKTAPISPGAYAALHRPTAIVTPSGEKTTFTYDLLGRKTAVTKGAESKLAATTTHVFDAVGNEIQSTSPTGQVTKHEYDARNRRIRTLDALNRAWTFAYDTDSGPSGPAPCCGADPTSNTRAATTIHPDGTKETRTTNAAGQLIATTDAKGDTVKYGYDPDGRLTTLTDAKGSVTTWRYDTLGKLQAKTYPDKTTELYEHDLAGQMTRRIRPDGTAATYTYSERGRLLKIDWSDEKTEDSTFAYNAAGHMTLAKNQSATLTRTYHPSGKLEKEISELTLQNLLATVNQVTPVNPVKNEVGYQYTPEGRLARLTYPDASTVSYEYNARGELSRVVDNTLETQNSQLITQNYTYQRREDGKITQITLPNGAKTTKTYDEVGRLKTIAHLDKEGKVLESETSRYDLRNRRTARIKADGSTDLFRYDPAGQVTAAAYSQPESVAGFQPASDSTGAATNSPTKNEEPGTKNFTPTQTFRYDAAGNRLEVTDNGMTTKYQPNEANQYTRIETSESAPSAESVVVEPQFDPLGNLLADDRNTYTWDSDIHLLSVTTKSKDKKQPGTKNKEQRTDFRYDALHRRVARLENNTQLTLFVMDGWNVISEFSSSPSLPVSKSPSLRLTWGEDLSGTLQGAGGIGGLLSSLHNVSPTKNQEQGTKNLSLFFHYDSNGNVILLTDVTSRESARYSYDAFGQTKTTTGIAADLNHYRFSTKPIEKGSGLAYYGYRYYDPTSGRWPSRDPIAERGGIYLYLAAKNNLPNENDSLGLLVSSVTNPTGVAACAELAAARAIAKNMLNSAANLYIAKTVVEVLTDEQLEEKKKKCNEIYAEYKDAQDREGESPCSKATTCSEAMASYVRLITEVDGRAEYIAEDCDKYIPTTVDHPEALRQKRIAEANCLAKMADLCGCSDCE